MNIQKIKNCKGKVVAVICDLFYKSDCYHVVLNKETGRVKFRDLSEQGYTHYQQNEFRRTQMIGTAKKIALEMILMSGR